MDAGMPFPFAELYGTNQSAANNNNRPRILRGVSISAWKPNDRAMRCGICVKKFGILRRRHHCRACGDVCCRRCLGFCLVDVPLAGVDISFTCIKCIRHHNTNPSLEEDFAMLATAFDRKPESKLVRTSRFNNNSVNTVNSSFISTPPSSLPNSPAPAVGSALTPVGSPGSWQTDYKVIISQYHNHKLHSVCSLLSDYLECKGGAVVLMQDTHVWVIAHRGLRTSAMQSSNFLSLCHHAMKSKEVFTASRDRKKLPDSHHETFRFFGAAPIFHKYQQFTPIGCIVALDTKLRDERTCKRVKKTLENLSRLVMNLLADEENVLRLYNSGEFKIFASTTNELDGRPTMSPTMQPHLHHPGITSPFESPTSASAPPAGVTPPHLDRSRSFVFGDTAGFFARYAGDPSLDPCPSLRRHAHSDPEPKTPLTKRPPPPLPPRARAHSHHMPDLKAA